MAKLLAQMKAINTGMKLLGSVWSPPGWMKLNGVQEGTVSLLVMASSAGLTLA
jgi:O-glycosyl hydrolase